MYNISCLSPYRVCIQSDSTDPYIVLPKPCVIDVGIKYKISVQFKGPMQMVHSQAYKNLIQLERDIEICFDSNHSDLVSRLTIYLHFS